MIDHQVHQKLDTMLFQLGNQDLDIVDATVARINFAVISDVVAHVDIGAFVARRQPHCINSELCNVVNFGDNAWDVAKAIGVEVFETCWVDLVDGGVVPPMACRLRGTVRHLGLVIERR